MSPSRAEPDTGALAEEIPAPLEETMFRTTLCRFAISTMLAAALGTAAFAQKKYDVGATDTEIRIGNIVAYSGPVSSLGVIAKTENAYFRKINDEGGINGRKIKFISYDDAYSPPKGGASPQAR
jgi:ABC-type branched-subunit amino acid transport system substrate-binding protein